MSEPIDCPTGQYQNNTGQSDCLPCPAGHECSNPAGDPQQCSAGFYSSGSAASCTACESGMDDMCYLYIEVDYFYWNKKYWNNK